MAGSRNTSINGSETRVLNIVNRNKTRKKYDSDMSTSPSMVVFAPRSITGEPGGKLIRLYI